VEQKELAEQRMGREAYDVHVRKKLFGVTKDRPAGERVLNEEG